MKTIALTKGKVALVDDDDFDRLSTLKWYAQKCCNNWYACRGAGKERVCMHWMVSGRKWVDHIDCNGLNNQKRNLRPCTPSQNLRNKRKQPGRTSSFKGVCKPTGSRRWRSDIEYQGKNVYLGYFDTEAEAALAYLNKAKELFGEFARSQ